VASQPARAARDAERALLLFGKKVGLDDELAALSVKGQAALGLGAFDEAKAAAKRRVELCQRAERRLDEIPALRALAMATAASGDRLNARTSLNNALKLARAAGHRVEEAVLHQALGDQLFISGAYAEAIARYQNAATLCAETGQSLARAECLKCIGRSYLHKGDYDRAVDHLRAAVDAFDRAASDDDVVRARCDLVHALLTRHALDEAGRILDGARPRARPGQARVAAELALAEGMLEMQRGSFGAAREGTDSRRRRRPADPRPLPRRRDAHGARPAPAAVAGATAGPARVPSRRVDLHRPRRPRPAQADDAAAQRQQGARPFPSLTVRPVGRCARPLSCGGFSSSLVVALQAGACTFGGPP
jgi:tetratricopeptide (TPR) repeat protein